ncbi:hypothetical protein RFI_20843, partial [Reticulomyxa filosa]
KYVKISQEIEGSFTRRFERLQGAFNIGKRKKNSVIYEMMKTQLFWLALLCIWSAVLTFGEENCGSEQGTCELGEKKTDVKCEDTNEMCKLWAMTGECEKSRPFMEKTCQKSCGLCGSSSQQEQTEKKNKSEKKQKQQKQKQQKQKAKTKKKSDETNPNKGGCPELYPNCTRWMIINCGKACKLCHKHVIICVLFDQPKIFFLSFAFC